MSTQYSAGEQIKAVTRGVEAGTREGRKVYVQSISQRYPTTAEDLWEACTSPQRLERWFAPVSGDLRLGGTYQVQGNAGGTIETCEVPRSFSATWEFDGQISWIAVAVEPEGEGARLTLEHIAYADDMAEFWQQFGPGAAGVGWDLAFLGLAWHVGSGKDKPEEADGWEGTDEGRSFITDSSAAWAEANVAFGAPRADAEGARDRTTAFYLGEGPGTE